MKRYIIAAEGQKYTEKEVISILRQCSAESYNTITISKGVAQFWSYERDFFAIAYIKDITEWANQHPEDFEMDPGWSIEEVGETAGARTAKGVEYMYERVRDLKEKYGITVKKSGEDYASVAEKAAEIYGQILDLGEENGIVFKEGVDDFRNPEYVKTLITEGKAIVIYPKLRTVLLKGRWAGLAAYLCPYQSYASDDSRKLSKLIRNNIESIRDAVGVPSLVAVGAQGNVQFNIDEVS